MKKRILIVITLILIIILTFLIILTKNEEETPLLYCYNELEQNGISQKNNYEFFKNEEVTKIIFKNELKYSDEFYNKIIKNGYDVENLNNSNNKQIKTKFLEQAGDLKENISYEFKSFEKGYLVTIEYLITKDKQEQFEEFFKYDLFNSSLNEIKKIYESGNLLCEIS